MVQSFVSRFGRGSAATVLVVMAVCVFAMLFSREYRPHLIENELVGWQLTAVVTRFGYPDTDLDRYEPLGTEPRATPTGPIRTLIYRDINGGSLHVWLNNDGGQWTCFESCWIADGFVL